MVGIIEQHNGEITQWSILAREQLPQHFSIHDLESLFQQWQQRHPTFQWKKEIDQDQGQLKMIGSKQNDSLHSVETLQLVATTNGPAVEGFILYQVDGTIWNQEMEEQIKRNINDNFPVIFQKTPTIFSCVKGYFNDKMDTVVMESERLKQGFQGEIIEKLEEENLVALTVKSPFFLAEMPTANGTFNMQMVLSENELNEKTTFVIGTPILTIEY